MSSDVDELFGEGSGQPRPRLPLAVALLVSGLVLAVGGLVCTSAPGGVLVLLSWMVLEKEVDRVDSGYLPLDAKPGLLRLQTAAQVGIAAVIAVFFLQGFLFCNGFYESLWSTMLGWVLTPA